MRSINVRVPLLALAAACAAACASAPRPASSAPASSRPAASPSPAPGPALEVAAAPRAAVAVDSGLLFAVEPAGAEIAIDGRPSGTVAELAAAGGLLRLAPGIYQVSLKAPGFTTWRAEVALRQGTETIRVKLARGR